MCVLKKHMESSAASLLLTAWTTQLVRVLGQKGNWLMKTGYSVYGGGRRAVWHPNSTEKKKCSYNLRPGFFHLTKFGFSVSGKITVYSQPKLQDWHLYVTSQTQLWFPIFYIVCTACKEEIWSLVVQGSLNSIVAAWGENCSLFIQYVHI